MKKRGFTLIELLVVIAVISILIMILLPVLSTVKNMSRLAQCGAQKHDVGIAVLGFVSDFGDAWWPGSEYDMPWEGPVEGIQPFAIGANNVGCWAYGNPAVALTQDFDPILTTSFLGRTPSDGVWMGANKQNYLASARYFFCPLSCYSYNKNYSRYAEACPSPTNPMRIWGTDAWYYDHRYDTNGANPALTPPTPWQHSNPASATALLSDFHSYNWQCPISPYFNSNTPQFTQAKTHWNFLMLDGGIKSFSKIRDVFAFMWSNQPANPTQIFDESGGDPDGSQTQALPKWTPQ
jgi:prepilin-type N-terminal cleavage/methylation domain-containing protein